MKKVETTTRPVCEECGEEMNRYGSAIDAGRCGWGCDLCGWSWDDRQPGSSQRVIEHQKP